MFSIDIDLGTGWLSVHKNRAHLGRALGWFRSRSGRKGGTRWGWSHRSWRRRRSLAGRFNQRDGEFPADAFCQRNLMIHRFIAFQVNLDGVFPGLQPFNFQWGLPHLLSVEMDGGSCRDGLDNENATIPTPPFFDRGQK